MKILKQAKRGGDLPTVDIGWYGYEHPIIDIQLNLKRVPTDAEFDALRIALKKWVDDCGFGELMQGVA